MDQVTYEKWWPLHLKAAKQEPLTAEEQAFYQAGKKELGDEEEIRIDYEEFRRLRAAIKAEEARFEKNMEKRKELHARIAELEASLSPRQRQLIGIQDG
jgi:hypothetical protein